jgi:hypothetical protein
VNADRLALRGPRSITLEVCQKFSLGGDGPREAQAPPTRRDGASKLTWYPVTMRVAMSIAKRHPRPADGFALETVDKDDVRWCVIDLHNVQRSF